MSEFFTKFLGSPFFGLSLVLLGILIGRVWGYLVWKVTVENARINNEEFERMVAMQETFSEKRSPLDKYTIKINDDVKRKETIAASLRESREFDRKFPASWMKFKESDGLKEINETSEALKLRMKIWEIEDRQRKEFREAVSKLMKAAGHE